MVVLHDFVFFFSETRGCVKSNQFWVNKRRVETIVNMEQQNPGENEVKLNIQTGKT